MARWYRGDLQGGGAAFGFGMNFAPWYVPHKLPPLRGCNQGDTNGCDLLVWDCCLPMASRIAALLQAFPNTSDAIGNVPCLIQGESLV